MENEQKSQEWRDDVSDSSNATLKILDGEDSTFTFLNEGEKKSHVDFGDSVRFEVSQDKEEKQFFVKSNNYSLLNQIKALGKITGKLVKISRTGSKKSDTRYVLEEVESKEEELKEEVVEVSEPKLETPTA